MIKPILKIEFPKDILVEDIEEINRNISVSEIVKEYHVLVIKGNNDFINVEIITASDVSIHKP